jgi:hypothetical protein
MSGAAAGRFSGSERDIKKERYIEREGSIGQWPYTCRQTKRFTQAQE